MSPLQRNYLYFLFVLATFLYSASVSAISVSPSPSYSGSYTVSWSNEYPTNGSAIVLQEKTGSGAWVNVSTPNGSLSKAYSGKSNNTYQYRLHSSGCAWGSCWDLVLDGPVTIQVLSPGTPSTPTGPSTSANGSYTISWGASTGATYYQLQEYLTSWSTIHSGSSRSVTRSGQGNGRWYYRARACSTTGCSGWTSNKIVDVALTPGTPSSISCSPSTSTTASHSVSWGSSSGTVTAYQLERSYNSGGYSNVYTGTASQNFSGLSNGNYNYRVRAYNTVGSYTTYSGYRTSSTCDVTSPPSFSINDVSVAEGGNLSFTVTKNGAASTNYSVNYTTANGSAISGSDYTANSGTLTFSTGETSKVIAVATTVDSTYESNETITLNLSSPSGGSSISDSQGVGTINNDDSGPAFTVNDVSANEGSGITFTITKSGATVFSHNIDYASADDSATLANNDYSATSGTLVFTSGESSKTVTVNTIEDISIEADETFHLNLSNATNGASISDSQGLGTILNNDFNINPVAVADSDTTTEDISVVVDVLGNDTDADLDSLSVSSVTQGSNGSVTNNTNNVTYTPNANYHGTDNFTYTVSDGQGGTDTATVTITIDSENDAPVGNNDSDNTNEDTQVTVDVLGNDSDVDGDSLSIVAVTQGANGTVTNNGNNISYNPNTNYHGTDNFTYTVSDGQTPALTDTATVTITVGSINDAPVAVGDNDTIIEETTTVFDVLANDSDIDLDSLSVSSVTQGANGSVTNNTTNVSYTPALNFTGNDSFTYTVSDGELSDTATVNVTVINENDGPTIGVNSPLTVAEGATEAITSAHLLGNDPDDAPAGLTYTVTTPPQHGQLEFSDAVGVAITSYTQADIDANRVVYVHDGSDPAGTGVFPIEIELSSLDGSNGFVIQGVELGKQDGLVMTAAGDINGDGIADAIMGAPTADPNGLTDAGSSYVIFGNGSGFSTPFDLTTLDGTNGFVINGVAAGDQSGYAVSAAGDVNGDGIDDLIIGAPYADPNGNADAGESYVVFGQSGGFSATFELSFLDGTNGFVLSGIDAGDQSGYSVAGIGDMNQDGLGDVLIGAPYADPNDITDAGESYVVFGAGGFVDSYVFSLADGGESGALPVVGTFNFNVTSIDDSLVATDDVGITDEDIAITIDVLANDIDSEGDPLTITSVTQGTNGVVTNNGSDVTYTPNGNYHGTDTFTYVVDDGNDDMATATVVVTINPVNDAPVGNTDTESTQEDVAGTFSVLLNDSDVDGDTLSVTDVTQGTNGSVTFTANDVTYTPNTNYHGADSFTYTVSDGQTPALTDTVTVNVTVDPVNDAPTLTGESRIINEDSNVTISVLANDTDDDGDTLSVASVGQGTNGSVVLNPDDTVTYTPAANFNGVDSFIYTVTDGTDSSIANVSITVDALNDAPVGGADTRNTDEDVAGTFSVLTNDTDVDGDTLSVTAVTQGTNGSVTFTANDVTYTPNENYHGTDSFTYTVSDGQTPALTDTVTVNVTVDPVNDAPTLTGESRIIDEDTNVTISVLANDTDDDGDTLSVASVGQGTNGSVVLNPDDTVTYTPAANFNGVDSFIYTVTDGTGSAVANVSITVDPVNDAPVAIGDSGVLDEETNIIIFVLNNDTDVDADDLSVSSTGVPTNGNTIINPDNSVTYTPNIDFTGNDTFTYTVSDGNGGSATANVDVLVNNVNDIPEASDDSDITNEDVAKTISVLSNDSDIDGDALIVIAVTQGNNGSVTHTVNDITYTPADDFNGTDTFTYTVSDGNGGSDTANVTITVNPVNDAPVATDDTDGTNEDTPKTIVVLDNDNDVEGDSLSISGVTQASSGSVTNTTTDVTYTPNADFNGIDSFTYTISDGNGGSDTANVIVTVNPVNDAPVAANDVSSVSEDSNITISVLNNDVDIDGDVLSISSITSASNGSVINNGNDVTYIPTPNFNGNDSFTYTLDDGNGGADTGIVNITINAVNDKPSAVNDSVETGEEIAVTIDVLANDIDIDGDILLLDSVTQGRHGVVTNNGVDITYTPNTEFNGLDRFTYTINDGNGEFSVGTVNVVVNPAINFTDSIELNLSDGGEDGSTPDSDTFKIIITPAQ